MRAAVYVRVSSREQADSGLGQAAQKERCLTELSSRGWDLATLVDEQSSAAGKRPKLTALLRTLDLGHADCLIVSRLDRLSRSVTHFGGLVERSQKNGWAIVVLDPLIDLSTPSGRMIGNIIASIAQWEREIGSVRTKEGLAALRARGVTKTGKKYVPKQPYSERGTIRRIVRLREEKGMSKLGIAKFLTETGVPTPAGAAAWSHKMVGLVLEREGVS